MNIAGLRYGKLIVLEDKGERDHRNVKVVSTQCDCGKLKKLPKAPFLSGANPEKCFECHKKAVKFFPAAVQKKF